MKRRRIRDEKISRREVAMSEYINYLYTLHYIALNNNVKFRGSRIENKRSIDTQGNVVKY